MNSKQTYLALVRTQYPKLYYAALQRVFGGSSGMGGLGDDLTDSINASGWAPDLSSIDTSVSSDVSDSINSAYNASISPSSSTQGGSTDWFGQLANAITTIAPTVVQTEAAQNLLNINTQRAQAGLPLYTSQGQIVTGSMLSPTSSSVAQMEAALAGGGTSILLIGGLALVAVLLLSAGGGHKSAA